MSRAARRLKQQEPAIHENLPGRVSTLCQQTLAARKTSPKHYQRGLRQIHVISEHLANFRSVLRIKVRRENRENEQVRLTPGEAGELAGAIISGVDSLLAELSMDIAENRTDVVQAVLPHLEKLKTVIGELTLPKIEQEAEA